MTRLSSVFVDSPLGCLEVSGDGRAIVSVRFVDRVGTDDARFPHLRVCKRRLEEYFAGERTDFTDLPLAPAGTSFARAVWEQLRAIRVGGWSAKGGSWRWKRIRNARTLTE